MAKRSEAWPALWWVALCKGPLGSLFGGVIGGAIGGQVGEEWWSWQRADLEKITPQAGA
ncbi:hypothetical protein [Microcystis aeruginosa]|uniref:hypothetical protein n=1 Tax=Microcystis aeruginosa TaxID=1126 RepID=UPI00232FE137|nr:hypothetical protein [Microcystis aeruginosa]MDB9433302.1 hypothetical protein [Microcystis aeruginosa CS-552/01]